MLSKTLGLSRQGNFRGGRGGSPPLVIPKLPTASHMPERAGQCSFQSRKGVQTTLQWRWHLPCTPDTPECRRGENSPPRLKTTFSHKTIPTRTPPPFPCTQRGSAICSAVPCRAAPRAVLTRPLAELLLWQSPAVTKHGPQKTSFWCVSCFNGLHTFLGKGVHTRYTTNCSRIHTRCTRRMRVVRIISLVSAVGGYATGGWRFHGSGAVPTRLSSRVYYKDGGVGSPKHFDVDRVRICVYCHASPHAGPLVLRHREAPSTARGCPPALWEGGACRHGRDAAPSGPRAASSTVGKPPSHLKSCA